MNLETTMASCLHSVSSSIYIRTKKFSGSPNMKKYNQRFKGLELVCLMSERIEQKAL